MRKDFRAHYDLFYGSLSAETDFVDFSITVKLSLKSFEGAVESKVQALIPTSVIFQKTLTTR